MSTRNKSLARPWASPQLHSGLQSTREYMKMNTFPSGPTILNLSGVLLMIDVQSGTHQVMLQMRNPMSNMMSFKLIQAVVNNNKGLTWEFTELFNSVNFLDLTLIILTGGKF